MTEDADSAIPFKPKTVAEVLGEIVWLLTQSPTHKQLFVGDLEWFCMPAILVEQFRTYPGPNGPAAVAFWATVSDETDLRLRAGAQKLRADEWRGGTHHWLIELVAPFGGQDEIIQDLSRTVFEKKSFNFHRVTPEGQRVVATVGPDGGLAA